VYGTLPNGVYATNTKTENSRDQPNLRALGQAPMRGSVIILKNIVFVFIARDKIQGVSLKQESGEARWAA